MGYTQIGKELGIGEKNVRRCFKEKGINGLEETKNLSPYEYGLKFLNYAF